VPALLLIVGLPRRAGGRIVSRSTALRRPFISDRHVHSRYFGGCWSSGGRTRVAFCLRVLVIGDSPVVYYSCLCWHFVQHHVVPRIPILTLLRTIPLAPWLAFRSVLIDSRRVRALGTVLLLIIRKWLLQVVGPTSFWAGPGGYRKRSALQFGSSELSWCTLGGDCGWCSVLARAQSACAKLKTVVATMPCWPMQLFGLECAPGFKLRRCSNESKHSTNPMVRP